MSATVLCFVLWALPSQIVKNYQEGRVGLSGPMVWFSLQIYLARIGYAIAIWRQRGVKPGYLMVPDLIGTLCATTIIVQYLYYHLLRLFLAN